MIDKTTLKAVAKVIKDVRGQISEQMSDFRDEIRLLINGTEEVWSRKVEDQIEIVRLLGDDLREQSKSLVNGEKGETGETGERGLNGRNGEKGERGKEGPQGKRGEQGEQGEIGGMGENGPQGLRGIQGETGEKGEKGDTGASGVDGVAGEQGEKGERGETGPRGENGERGAAGSDGIDGKDGTDGEDGIDRACLDLRFHIAGNVYKRGDLVQYRGGIFQAVRSASGSPDDDPMGFRVAVNGFHDMEVSVDLESRHIKYTATMTNGDTCETLVKDGPRIRMIGDGLNDVKGDIKFVEKDRHQFDGEKWIVHSQEGPQGIRGRKGNVGKQGERGEGFEYFIEGGHMVITPPDGEEVVIDLDGRK